MIAKVFADWGKMAAKQIKSGLISGVREKTNMDSLYCKLVLS